MRWASVAVAIVLVGLATGCGDKHEKLMKKTLDYMEAQNEILSKVKDEESLKEAIPKIKKLSEEMEQFGKDAKDLGEPSKEKQLALVEKYGGKMGKQVMLSGEHMKRIGKLKLKGYPELMKAVGSKGSPSFPMK